MPVSAILRGGLVGLGLARIRTLPRFRDNLGLLVAPGGSMLARSEPCSGCSLVRIQHRVDVQLARLGALLRRLRLAGDEKHERDESEGNGPANGHGSGW